MAYDKRKKKKEMEAAKEDAPKIEAEAVAENAPIAEKSQRTQPQMLITRKV
jgi:hypothetical protein